MTETPSIDPNSAYGKFPVPDQCVDVLVVGAGPAGIAAAMTAAQAGFSVMLVEETPVSGELIGLDVPFFFGGRAAASVQNQMRMVEQIMQARPGIADAFEAGVDVQLGTAVWGLWTGATGQNVVPMPVAGLATEERTWLVGFAHVIVASGTRDLVFSFPGSDTAGVMGARAFRSLLSDYNAFNGRRLIILGTGVVATQTATLALDTGLAVAAMIEIRNVPQAPDTLIAPLIARGVEIMCNTVPLAALSTPEGLRALQVGSTSGIMTETREIACDTVVIAVGEVPSVELLDVAGVPLVMDPARGGYVPVCDGQGITPVPEILVAGSVTGLAADPAAQGQAAALAAAGSRGDAPSGIPAGVDYSYRMDWMRTLLDNGAQDTLACTCEEITRQALLDVAPPHYLGCSGGRIARRSLATLLQDGPPDHDQLKRLTRVSMGPCQARRCREQIAMMIALSSGVDMTQVPLAGYRIPVRPLTLRAMAAMDDPDTHNGWHVWFGIPTQWVPYADVGTPREAERLGEDTHL
ncbi:MAG: FAD-dependent oxidoreductase [Acetobacter sp.]|uniref:FAD-dependent oxidoreductase n=1 Tax=Acetobacter sp. TaxID=440 RepID=UPI0039E7843D